MMIGHSLELLIRRLMETPQDFMYPPRKLSSVRVHVAAVVNDVFALRGCSASMQLLGTLSGEAKGPSANELTLAAVMAWLLADEAWSACRMEPDRLQGLFAEIVPALAKEATADRYVLDVERREELARSAIARLGLLPKGETLNQASDRLAGVSGVERRRLLEASRHAEARAREIREALARKAAEESADKWTRE